MLYAVRFDAYLATVWRKGGSLFILGQKRENSPFSKVGYPVILGVKKKKLKEKIICYKAALVTGIMVSVSGTIGFVGLIVPHIARTLVGTIHRRLIPFAALLGGIFMIWADAVARVIVAPSELPIGVVTAFIGAPFFLVLLRRSRYSFQ